MAIDQDSVVTDIAVRIVQQSDKFVNALMELRDLFEWTTKADINFNDFATLFGEDSGNDMLKHVDSAMLNQVLGNILGADSTVSDSVMHHLTSTTVGAGTYSGKTYWEMVEMMRRNGA